MNETAAYGQVTSFALGKIGGAEHILASAAAGIANIPVAAGGEWSLGVGALAFYFSDISVARDRFVGAGFGNRLWGLPLYYFAQILFALACGDGVPVWGV